MQLIIVRHGETEWTLSGQHTGHTEIPLTEHGRHQAASLQHVLTFVLQGVSPVVYTSPRQRAIDTMLLAFPDARGVVTPLLGEWDYGSYEGKTSAEITSSRPGWNIWRDGCPDGESVDQVAERADRFLKEFVEGSPAPVVVFSHGHFSRVLTARVLELAPEYGALFDSTPASVSTVQDHQGRPSVGMWNVSADLVIYAREHG